MTDTDATLLKRIQQGDSAAFQTLYERHGLALLNYILQITGNRQGAEDVLQEVMLTVWQKAHTYREIGEVRGWLFGIARNQALKATRGKTTHVELHDEQLPAEENMSNGVIRQVSLKAAIQTLPPTEQAALEMVYYRGMTLQEVAEITHVPLNTVKTRLHRARQRLRHCLEDEVPDHAR